MDAISSCLERKRELKYEIRKPILNKTMSKGWNLKSNGFNPVWVNDLYLPIKKYISANSSLYIKRIQKVSYCLFNSLKYP